MRWAATRRGWPSSPGCSWRRNGGGRGLQRDCSTPRSRTRGGVAASRSSTSGPGSPPRLRCMTPWAGAGSDGWRSRHPSRTRCRRSCSSRPGPDSGGRRATPPYTPPMRSRPDRPHAGNPALTVLGFPGVAELKRRLPRLLIGLLALGSGTGMMVEAELGVSPYDVLHQGLADLTGLSFGAVVIGLGAIILLLWIPIGQRLGIGTVINTLVVGLIIDA